MIRSLILLNFALGVFCGICLNGLNSGPVSLSNCVQYSNDSCCTTAQDSQIETNFKSQIIPVLGLNNCSQNFLELLCAWTCSSRQADFILVTNYTQVASTYNYTVYVNSSFVNAFYNSCKDECWNIPGSTIGTVEQRFGSFSNPANGFIEFFDSSSDPLYNPGPQFPILSYLPGEADPNTQMSLSSELEPRLQVFSTFEAEGCPKATTGTGLGPSTLPSFFNFLFAILYLLLNM
jgi:hypothetical protein